MSDACIVLANGQIFWGSSMGQTGFVIGEAVFNTGMTGYIETLTDPSYYGQIVTQTFPLIGNYGFIEEDAESAAIHLKGYVVRSLCDMPSNFRCKTTLDTFLKKHNVVGIQGIDTRKLTKILREAGVMNAAIISGETQEAKNAFIALNDTQKKQELLNKIAQYKIVDAVNNVSCNAQSIEEDTATIFTRCASYRNVPVLKDGTKLNDISLATKKGAGHLVVLWDFGAKANIRRELLKRGLIVKTVGATATCDEILSLRPSGVMLSNGPGDPMDNTNIIEELKKLTLHNIPIFGICLGHQLLALSQGACTTKLKYGHRGANQPVKDMDSGRIYITSQNHGYAVVSKSLPAGAIESFVNMNDGTCEGLRYTNICAFSVQFHPEACGGPLDTGFLFDDFVERIVHKEKGDATQ